MKHKIQDLIDQKILILNVFPTTNVNMNALLYHQGRNTTSINMVYFEEALE